MKPFGPLPTVAFFMVLTAVSSACWGQASAARECLEQAEVAATQIQLSGDKSTALDAIATTLVQIDPMGALDVIGRMRRPTDAARGLGAVSIAIMSGDPAAVEENMMTAGRLLLRISNEDQRLMEQKLLLRETAVLGERALPGAPELSPRTAQREVVLALAPIDADAALMLIEMWGLEGPPLDEALAAVAEHMANVSPDRALELTESIVSARWRDRSFWRIAEKRPAAEAVGVALRISDPLVRASTQASAAVRLAKSDLDEALAAAEMVAIAPDSVRAEIAVALAYTDGERAIALAEELPASVREWALGRIGVELARSAPELAAEVLLGLPPNSDAVRRAAARMATVDLSRAITLAHSLPEGSGRDAARSGIVSAIAESDRAAAEDMLWDIQGFEHGAEAVEAVVLAMVESNPDAATGLIGLVSDADQAARLRARVAARLAVQHPELALQLLESLPPSDFLATAGIEAGSAILANGGKPETAARFASLGVERDFAMRWILPGLAESGMRSPINLADTIGDSYARALALVDVAQRLLEIKPEPTAVDDREQQIRVIAEWETL